MCAQRPCDTAVPSGISVDALSTRPSRPCPDCGVVSRRVHSRYRPTLADCPVGARPWLVRLTVRRFFQDALTCLVCKFVERVPGLTERHQQTNTELGSRLRAVAAELGGRVGRRTAVKEPSLSMSIADTRSTSFRTGPPRRRSLGCTITLGSR
ncbi:MULTISPECIES: transposase family protein [unclassified Streptomyces]|uniref:transposase family protein n=1 Tax=unclassified Streptomyces TaxID=2593676 RepID=UPI00359C945A